MLSTRSLDLEIMDVPGASPRVTRAFHRDLKRIHRLMGNWRSIAGRLQSGEPVRSVVDVGCGDAALLAYLRDHAGILEVIGVDRHPPDCSAHGVRIIAADATRDSLPRADAAVCAMLLHHLTDDQVIAFLRNAGRSCRRLICLDPVRHWLPMLLYTTFVCPIVSPVGAKDGRQSIRRSFRPSELRALAQRALEGTSASFDLWVSPAKTKLILDVNWF